MRIDSWLHLSGAACRNLRRKRHSGIVAKVIEFYIPKNFRKSVKWILPEERGKIIEFALAVKKSA
jgi:hypothetical protein